MLKKKQNTHLGSIEMQMKIHFNKHQCKRQHFESCSWSCRFISFLMHIIVHHGLIPHFLELQQFSAGRHRGEVQLYYAFWQPILFLLEFHILAQTIRDDCYEASPEDEAFFPSVIKSWRRWMLLHVYDCNSMRNSPFVNHPIAQCLLHHRTCIKIHIKCHRTFYPHEL